MNDEVEVKIPEAGKKKKLVVKVRETTGYKPIATKAQFKGNEMDDE